MGRARNRGGATGVSNFLSGHLAGVAVSPIVVTVKIHPRYMLTGRIQTPVVYDRIVHKSLPLRQHQHRYTLVEFAAVVDYLNDRVSGYPVPSALLTLRSEHNEDRRQAKRGKGRTTRK